MSRIYKSENQGVSYQGAARSIGFNPRQAADQSKKTQQLKNAIVADGETISREIQRVQRAENTILQAQQEVDRSTQRNEQTVAKNNLGIAQATAKGDFANNQLFDRNLLKSEQTYESNVLKGEQTAQNLSAKLDSSFQQLSNQASNTKTKLIGSTINSLLDFGGSVIKYGQDVKAAEELAIAEQREADEINFQNNAAFGDNFWDGAGPSAEVEAVSNATNAGFTAEAQALGDAADEVQSGGTAEDGFMAEQIRGMSSWAQTAGSRQNVYAARTQYPAFLAEAQANGLIRPGAEGYADIQRLTAKFGKALGLNQADPKLVADIFSKSALGSAQNTLTAVTNTAATEMKEAREGRVDSNIAVLVDGIPKGSSSESMGQLWEEANTENVNGNFFGRKSGKTSRDTTIKVAEALAAQGKTAELLRLKDYAPNPDTPNLTLGKQYADVFQEQVLKSRQAQRTEYTLGKGERNRQAEALVNDYWSGDASPEALRQTEAALREINTPESRRLADSLVQEGYNYDPDVARDIASRRGTENEASQAEIKDAVSKGLISPAEGKEALKYAPDAQLQTKIDEAVKLYAPQKGMTSAITGEGGRSVEYKASRASNAFKAELRQRESRFKIELGKRLQSVLRDNRDLDPKSQEFQELVEKETAYLMKQERFQITYDAGNGGFSFGSDDLTPNLPDRITLSPGVQDVTKLTATQTFQTLKLNKGLFDPSEDNIISRETLEAESLAIVDGGKPSKRTNDWAAALGISSKDLINGQRLRYGLPPLDRLKQDVAPTSSVMVEGNKTAGMNALRDLDFPTRGAAYMSSAIQHESAWAAQRPSWDLGPIDNAGRNGGLLSWNNGRLRNLESRYGRPVEKITQAEQLQFLKDELRTSYKDSYDIFMDPNASSGDLEWATWNYIRWNKKYTGTRWSTAENLIRWGDRNP